MSEASIVALAAGAASLVAAAAAGWLTPAGIAAAAVVGTAVWAGDGAPGVALLLLFFVGSVAAGRVRRTARGGEDRPDRRGASQVLANGGVAAAAGLAGAAGALPPTLASAALAGALAAATADTWASELGAAAAGPTRRLLSGRRVPPGTAGGVSAAGLTAAATGALLAAAVSAWGRPASVAGWMAAVGAAGIVGALADSVAAERLEVADEGAGNHGVNLLATTTGALVAAALVSL